MQKNLLKELLKRPVALNPIFIKITGRLTSGYFLSQVMYWYFVKDKESGQEFYKTDQEWMDELYLSRREVESSKRDLLIFGFISIEKKEKGNKCFYTFNQEKVHEAILNSDGKVDKQRLYKNGRFAQSVHTCRFAHNEHSGSHITSEPNVHNEHTSFTIYTETTQESTTEKVGKGEKEVEELKYPLETFEYKAAEFFIDSHLGIESVQLTHQVKKTGRAEILQDYADTVNKLKRIDSYTETQIMYILKFLFEDTFWRAQIQSMHKLREKNRDGIPYFVVLIDKVKNGNLNRRQVTFG